MNCWCAPNAGSRPRIDPNGVVAVLDGVVAWVGPASAASEALAVGPTTRMLNAEGRVVMPGLVECHTHLAFAGSRATNSRRARGRLVLRGDRRRAAAS